METESERRRQRLSSQNPLTGEEVGDFPIMSAMEVRGLVNAAREAQAGWSHARKRSLA
jgi:acyl-CoA reductase-like NAD-dependent aldehyde dehydrogenase